MYALSLPDVTRLYVTRVHQKIGGDALFPEVDMTQWQLIEDVKKPLLAACNTASEFIIDCK